jgi:hypothetical protein
MLFNAYLTLVTSLTIAAVAGWYSIVGLMTIFSGAAIPVAIMGASLEIGKLVTASWLYRNWNHTNLLMKFYLTIAVAVLMLITSMGIFGFLSKAHIDQTILGGGGNELQIQMLETKIERDQKAIADAEKVLSILDGEITILQSYDRIRGPDGAIAVRKSQQEERDSLNETISSAQVRITEAQSEMLPLKKEALKLEAEVGPLKYIAELIYGSENAKNYFDVAVRWIILIIVSVFDPLAVILLIAANSSLARIRYSRMFTDNGDHIVDPSNVMIADDPVDFDLPKQ